MSHSNHLFYHLENLCVITISVSLNLRYDLFLGKLVHLDAEVDENDEGKTTGGGIGKATKG